MTTPVPQEVSLCLTEETTLGLFFIQRYRFLTIDQFARAGGLTRATARNRLRILERHSLLNHFGNTGLQWSGQDPEGIFFDAKGLGDSLTGKRHSAGGDWPA